MAAKQKKIHVCIWAGLLLAGLAGCANAGPASGTDQIAGSYSGSGHQVFSYGNNTAGSINLTVSLAGLSNTNVLVALTNTGSEPAVVSSNSSLSVAPLFSGTSAKYQVPDYVASFYLIAPPLVQSSQPLFALQPLAAISSPPYTVDISTYNWLTSSNSQTAYDPVATTLRGIMALNNTDGSSSGRNVCIWVQNSFWDASGATDTAATPKMTTAKVTAILQKFASNTPNIYGMSTRVGGEPWGNHSYSNMIAASKRDIHIVFYDIAADLSLGNIMGFFWSANNYLATGTSSVPFSNEALVFFMDIYRFSQWASPSALSWSITDYYPQIIVSTLAHEFQHMIQFYQKTVLQNTVADTWLNEMASQGMEDLTAFYLSGTGTGPAFGQNGELARYAQTPYCNITYWASSQSGECNIYDSYATAYSFGAFLLRQFGGGSFLTTLIQMPFGSMADAISPAIMLNGGDIHFKEALSRWGASLAMNPARGAWPPGYGYPALTVNDYYGTGIPLRLEKADPYAIAGVTPQIFTAATVPAVLQGYSTVIYNKLSLVSGNAEFKVFLPASVYAKIVATPGI